MGSKSSSASSTPNASGNTTPTSGTPSGGNTPRSHGGKSGDPLPGSSRPRRNKGTAAQQTRMQLESAYKTLSALEAENNQLKTTALKMPRMAM